MPRKKGQAKKLPTLTVKELQEINVQQETTKPAISKAALARYFLVEKTQFYAFLRSVDHTVNKFYAFLRSVDHTVNKFYAFLRSVDHTVNKFYEFLRSVDHTVNKFYAFSRSADNIVNNFYTFLQTSQTSMYVIDETKLQMDSGCTRGFARSGRTFSYNFTGKCQHVCNTR